MNSKLLEILNKELDRLLLIEQKYTILLKEKEELQKTLHPDNACFEVHNADGCVEASAVGPRELALKEIQHYAFMYGLDGPVKIYEVIRLKLTTEN